MSEMINVKATSKLWNISERRITALCNAGKIDGAYKSGKSWLIPKDTTKPEDGRFNNSNNKRKPKLPLPVGVSDYILASSEYYYIDKTMMIKDFIDEKPVVSLFTRPRRFGKTLNMDMLRTFFEKTDKDTSIYFKDKNIWKCGEKYRLYQGKYPVIFITFKDIKYNSWTLTLKAISKIFSKEASRHMELLESDACNKYEKESFEKILSSKCNEVELSNFLSDLSHMLHKHHKVAPVIIIDEYDIPIQQGYISGFYDEIIMFMRNLFSAGLKDSKDLSFGFMTGILKVSKESIFSGLNNLMINSILDDKYSSYFGFTKDEIISMCKYYEAEDRIDEICEWYDGYRFGNTDIFNPWSVINYFSNSLSPRACWQSTGSNDIIGTIMNESDTEIYDKLTSLLSGQSVTTYIDTSVIYPEIKNNSATIYSFLLVAGYLKATNKVLSDNGNYICDISLPNKEISQVYHKEVLDKLNYIIPQRMAIAIEEAIYKGDSNALKELISILLIQSVSSFDTVSENFYHGLMLGICALFSGSYISSNRESGFGRYDIELKPLNKKLPGIIIELKYKKDCTNEELKKLANDALNQINDNQYDTNMKMEGIKSIYKYGVAFSGKHIEISQAEE